MMKKSIRAVLILGMVVLANCGVASHTQAAFLMVGQPGTKVILSDGAGSPGGEFGVRTNQVASATPGLGAAGTWETTQKFTTFCVEKNEFISFSGGLSPEYFAASSYQTKDTGKMLNAGAAALYRGFTDLILQGGTGTSIWGESYNGTATDQNLLQNAIWGLQTEQALDTSNRFVAKIIALGTSIGFNFVSNNVLALTGANQTTYGGVGVMNLWTSYNSTTGVYSGRIQDQLARVSEPPRADTVPEPATMILFGLGAIGAGWSVRRRQA